MELEPFSHIIAPPPGVNIDSTPADFSWYDENGIYCTMPLKNGRPLSFEEVKANTEKWMAENPGKKIKWLYVVGPKSSATKEVREYLDEVLPKTIQAMALITSSVMHRMIVNLFLKLKPQPFPVQMFSEVEEAKKWLLAKD